MRPRNEDFQQCHRCHFASVREFAFRVCPTCHNTVCTGCIAANLDICQDCWSDLGTEEIPKDLPPTPDSGAPGSLKDNDLIEKRLGAYRLIYKERNRQLNKWGDQRHTHEHWLSILTEEVGELAQAMNEDKSKAEILGELTQVAAVAVAWLEDMYSPVTQDREPDACHSLRTYDNVEAEAKQILTRLKHNGALNRAILKATMEDLDPKWDSHYNGPDELFAEVAKSSS